MKYLLLILCLLASTVSAENWHKPNPTENIRVFDNYDRTKIKVGQKAEGDAVNLEWISWPGLPESTYFRIQVDVGLDPVYTNGDTTFFGSDEFRGRIFNTADGRLEWDFTFQSKPGNQYSWTFPIEHNNLVFLYQPELTAEEIANGDTRPDSVVGSYAIYHSTKKNNAFKTGKAIHAYCPEAWDSAGDTVWLDLDIDTVANELTISATRAWMRNATYPVTFDPILGKNSEGGSEGTYQFLWTDNGTTDGTGGDVDSFTFYHADGGNAWIRGAVYDATGASDRPGNLLGVTDGDSTFSTDEEWVSLELTAGPTLSASTKYWFGWIAHQGIRFSYDSDGQNNVRTNDNSVWPDFPDPGATNGGFARITSQYITYTAGEAAAYPMRRRHIIQKLQGDNK